MSYQVYKEYLQQYHDAFGTNKMYVVAYYSAHTGELTQKIVFAKSELVAANAFLGTDFASMEEVHDYGADTDTWINVLEINNTLTE